MTARIVDARNAAGETDLTEDELQRFIAIVEQREEPDLGAYLCGWYDRASDRPFGPGRFPFGTIEGLSWRIGWNDRALLTRDE
jgi:hypothetical protein